jgi:aromatic ring-opening dioxygenase LigB subunit
MSLVMGAILPHGGEAIPELAGNRLDLFAPTREGLVEAGRVVRGADPEVLIVVTPHGIRAEGRLAISYSERTEGIMTHGGARVVQNHPVHRPLARALADAADEAGIPTALLSYGASSGPHSCLPMDWGAQVPLHFIARGDDADPSIPVVTVVPSRALDFETLARFGEVLHGVASDFGERVVLVASSDLCHAHDANGPYGFDPAAAELDRVIVDCVKEDRLEDLLHVNPTLIERGKPDGLWQIAMLTGCRRHVAWRPRFLAYQVPTYFGMLSAVYTPS